MTSPRDYLLDHVREGAAAQHAGEAKASNPHAWRSLEHVAWECGYDHAALLASERSHAPARNGAHLPWSTRPVVLETHRGDALHVEFGPNGPRLVGS